MTRLFGNDIDGSEIRLCKYCGCCSANEDDSPGCVGTIPAGSHDGPEYLTVSRYWQLHMRDIARANARAVERAARPWWQRLFS